MKKLIFLVIVVALALGGMKVYQSIKRGMVVGDAAIAEFHDALSLQKEGDIY